MCYIENVAVSLMVLGLDPDFNGLTCTELDDVLTFIWVNFLLCHFERQTCELCGFNQLCILTGSESLCSSSRCKVLSKRLLRRVHRECTVQLQWERSSIKHEKD